MILYDLRCRKNHVFEAWFRDSAAYDDQVEAGEIACPTGPAVSQGFRTAHGF